MTELHVIVYTMDGCPFCDEFKQMLTKEGIEYHERDIDDFKEEYDTFSKITENDMVPALMLIESNDEKHKSFLYVPEKNYFELTEAVDLINTHRKKLQII